MVDLLKLHLFVFFASVSCFVVFIVVYYKTYTDAQYNDIGSLMMLCALSGAVVKPAVCFLADRYNNYKQCLMTVITVVLVFNFPLSILPFYPQLLFAEPHPRFIWYLLATINLISCAALGVAITLNDVFVMHKCSISTNGSYFGQYRFYGVLGWGSCSLGLAFVESYIDNLPHLALPMAVNSILILLDLAIVYRLDNIDLKGGAPSTISDEYLNQGEKVLALSKPLPPTFERTYLSQQQMKVREIVSARSSLRSSINLENRPSSIKSAGEVTISLKEQIDLLLRLNRYDNFNLLKYLLLLIIMGAFMQIHYVFYMQFMVDVMRQRNLMAIFFTFNAVIQISSCTGESLGLLFISRLAQSLGRDLSLVLCIVISGVRYAIAGFLVDYLNIWLLAIIDIQSGILFGLTYTLMTETAACYLSILDKLLLVDTDTTTDQEDQFISYLEQMKEVHSIESIRFALKATIQSIFSGSCEGIGFALGPFVAGFWLNSRSNSIEVLYQDMAGVHLVVLCSLVLLEFGIIRLVLGISSRADKMRVGRV